MCVLETFFNKVAGLQVCNFIKKRLKQRCFPVNTVKYLRTPTLKNIDEWLLFEDWEFRLPVRFLIKIFRKLI